VPDLTARLARLDTLFGVELADRLQSLNTLILQLEQGSNAHGGLGPVRRELHSLKGAAQAVGATSIEQIAHAAEGATLAQAAKGNRVPDQDWFDALYAALDFIKRLRDDPSIDASTILQWLIAQAPETPAGGPLPTTVRPAPVADLETTQSFRAAPIEARPIDRPAERAEQNSVRVSIGKLDMLLTESGELSVTHLRIAERLADLRAVQRQLERWQHEWSKTRPVRARLRRAQASAASRDSDVLLRTAERFDQDMLSILMQTRELVGDLAQNTSQLASVSGAIGAEVIKIRLLPAGTVFQPLERLVRDLSRQTGKEARLVLSGTDTEVDRRILDELRDPLMHMVRNTIDHGLESPHERLEAGKQGQGTLHMSATQRGDRVLISIEDDGRGLHVDTIREAAVRCSLVTRERAAQMDGAAIIDLIFHPGFSTRDTVTEISGRGVGMDVVREHVSRLGGDINVRTTPGKGTCFTLSVPLTLATTRVLLVEDGGQMFAVPSSGIERTGRVRTGDMQRLEGRRALQLDGRVVPVVELAELLQRQSTDVAEPTADEWRPFFILPQGDRVVAILTDRLVDETELVVKALGAPLTRVRYVGGAAVLGTGSVVVILNPGDLIKSALGNLERAPRNAAPELPSVAEITRRRILVVDDSVMTRTLERTILEAAGYTVIVATDGAHALERLAADPHIDAIVSDIEMPRMNGLELTAAVRQDERWRHLPVVLVTSLDSAEQIERGAAAGADAYIVKGRFDQNDLLQTVSRLL
jgi:two-component system chemotaxis sensor kinase CheA